MTIYKCENCDKLFDQKCNFDYHVLKRKIPCQKKKNYEKKTKFECQNCNNTFATKFTLERHILEFCKGQNLEKKKCEMNLNSLNNTNFIASNNKSNDKNDVNLNARIDTTPISTTIHQ